MMSSQLDEMWLECLRNCTECHNVCLQTVVSSDVVGKIGVEDQKLLLNCAELCRTCADFLNTGSAHHRVVCGACAELCAACAQMCERSGIGVMRQCAQVCRRCEDSCRRMAAMP